MRAADPWGTALAVGLAAAPLGALLVRRGRHRLGALAGALAAAAVLGAARPGGSLELWWVAALAGAVAARAIPGLPAALLRRRSFGSAYPRGAFGGAMTTATLPLRIGPRRPSGLLDAADRLRLESALADAERKHGVAIAIALVAHAAEPAAGAGRAALFGGALALAVAAALGANATAGFAAAVLGALAALALARSAFVRRLFISEAALASASERAASDAFAHAALAAAPRDRGLLVFASLFEARVAVLAGRGLTAASGAERALEAIATAAARGLAGGRAVEGFLAAVAEAEGLAARECAVPPRDGARPHPIRVED